MLFIQVCLRDLDEKINETVNIIDMINTGSGLLDFTSVQEIACWTWVLSLCNNLEIMAMKSTFNVSESDCEARYLRSICVCSGIEYGLLFSLFDIYRKQLKKGLKLTL